MRVKALHLWAAILALGIPAVAAEDSLQEILRAIQRENPGLKAAEARWNAMRQRAPQERGWDDPMVGLDVERDDTTRLDKFTDIEWMASQQIPVSGKNLSRGRIADAESRAVFEDLRRTEIDLGTKARIAYARLVNAHAQIELNRKNEALLKQLGDISKAGYEAGTAPQSDLLAAQIELLRLEANQAALEQQIAEQEVALNTLMHRSPGTPLHPATEAVYHPFSIPQAELEKLAAQSRPEIAQATHKNAAAQAQLQLAKRAWIPDPQLRVEARQYNGTKDGIREYDTGLFFSVPWVNHRKYSAAIEEAKQTVEATAHDEVAARREVAGMIGDQLRKIASYAKTYLLYRDKLVPLARQTVDTARANYEANKTGFSEFSTARRTLQDAESAMLDQLANHDVAVAELSGIVGGLEKAK